MESLAMKAKDVVCQYKISSVSSQIYSVSCKGNSTLAAEHFMLSVDQAIVNGHITIFSDALILMFGSYYCTNISYPVAQAASLEFLQRCLKINPDKGSKVEWNTSKKNLAVNPKVLTLIAKIADYVGRQMNVRGGIVPFFCAQMCVCITFFFLRTFVYA
ncbi:unnamed protein product [Oreochromis niloticus]|nr:unnamed protein product [Mustela putorius furo]